MDEQKSCHQYKEKHKFRALCIWINVNMEQDYENYYKEEKKYK
jgi:hypothetical protein